ncbi:MAG: DUF1700 domain-containing protein [Clostridia bacterium]|nr:DUF1700 domain-containing protein [Clostridia bacterium]
MTYNEWRDELKYNLLCVPEQERKRVLDYYAEAYADRRDAGYSEREITAEFGAPYDAAQRILSESNEQYNAIYMNEGQIKEPSSQYGSDNDCSQYDQGYLNDASQPKSDVAQQSAQYASQKTSDRSWVFVLLCVIFAVPIFGIFMAMVGVTVSFCVTPFALLIAGVATIGAGVGELFSNAASGAVTMGMGLVLFGVSLIIMPLFLKLVKLMWQLFLRFFAWLKSLFDKKERI